jgi:hypothetical protein
MKAFCTELRHDVLSVCCGSGRRLAIFDVSFDSRDTLVGYLFPKYFAGVPVKAIDAPAVRGDIFRRIDVRKLTGAPDGFMLEHGRRIAAYGVVRHEYAKRLG